MSLKYNSAQISAFKHRLYWTTFIDKYKDVENHLGEKTGVTPSLNYTP